MNSRSWDLEIITFNVRGLGNFSKRKDVFDFLRGQNADIICLQELHITPGKEHIFRNEWGGRAFLAPLSSVAGGVGILIQNKTACKVIDMVTNEKGSAILLTLEVNGENLRVANVYGPPERDDSIFFDEFFKFATPDREEHLIICGDWNVFLNPELDSYNYVSRDRRAQSRKVIHDNCQKLNLHDVWRLQNGDRKQFSWRKSNPVKCSRIDYFLVSQSILNKTASCEILPAYRSDHSRVSLRLNLTSQPRGRGLWKFNCSLLKDLTYLNIVKETIRNVVHEYACPIYSSEYISSQEARQHVQMIIDDSLFLETLLMQIRARTIRYTIDKARQRNDLEKRKLTELQTLESLPNPTSRDMSEIDEKQWELQNLRSAANEGRIIRSRARWYEEGEKGSSSYFLKMEKRNFESKLIPSLNVTNRIVKDSDGILSELSQHFIKLYARGSERTNSEINAYLDEVNVPTLTDEEAELLERDITIGEIAATLMHFSNNRSPGSDGFPYEFYKVFWGDLKWFVFKSLEYGLKRGELSITQREGIITLVPKPSKPKNFISSWRPITLLNSTYKMLAGTIANRLKKVLNNIIHSDQTAFLRNRYIGENIRTTYDVLWEAQHSSKQGLLLSIDFQSAFDVMNWKFLESCLRKFRFSEKFINMFWCLHRNTFSRISYNGELSREQILLERGSRQGDPISCYLFIIGAEILSNKVRQNDRIKGIKLNNEAAKIIQYADDTTLFLDGSDRSLREVFKELGWFSKYSGLKPNISKCHAMWIGECANLETKICPEIELDWVKELKLLGVTFTPKCANITDENIKRKKDAILRTIATWQGRCLSLVGKITITKSLLLPKITHILSALPNPSDKLIKDLNAMFFTFIYGSKRNPVRRRRLCQSIDENGLSMIDTGSFIQSLKMKWVKRFVKGSKSTWYTLIPLKLQREFIWNYGVVALKEVAKSIANPFWKDVVTIWMHFSNLFDIPAENISNENIFHSDHTKFRKNSYRKWERRGVHIIGDLFENNKILSWERFKEIYGINCNYLDYHSLLHSLPQHLRRDQPDGWNQERPYIPARIYFLLNHDSYTKTFNRSALNSNIRSDTDMIRIENKWKKDVGYFEQGSALTVKTSISLLRYTSFQYKFAMRIITTNSFLFKINRKDHDRCTFCDRNPETLKHLFITCPHVRMFWEDISRLLPTNVIGQLNDKTKCFGDSENALLTHIVTVAKLCIYDARYKETKPSIHNFKLCIKRDYETEKYIAMNGNNMEVFENKWSKLQNTLVSNNQ